MPGTELPFATGACDARPNLTLPTTCQYLVNPQEGGGVLRCNFYTHANDIKFGLFHKPAPDATVRSCSYQFGAAQSLLEGCNSGVSSLRGVPRLAAQKDMWEPVVPMEKYDSQKDTVRISHECQKPGHYAVHFDNAYSFMTGKTLLYEVLVSPPGDE